MRHTYQDQLLKDVQALHSYQAQAAGIQIIYSNCNSDHNSRKCARYSIMMNDLLD